MAFGAKWFRYMCDLERKKPVETFQGLVRNHFRGALKPPFNDKAEVQQASHHSFTSRSPQLLAEGFALY